MRGKTDVLEREEMGCDKHNDPGNNEHDGKKKMAKIADIEP